MTEAEWLACSDPMPMLAFLQGKVSDRKLRLFAAACCWHLDSSLKKWDREGIEVAERFADGRLNESKMNAKWEALQRHHAHHNYQIYGSGELFSAIQGVVNVSPRFSAISITRSILIVAYWRGPAGYDVASINARYAGRERERARQISIVRDHFGNPFCPVSFDPSWLRWNDGTVPKIAQAIYDDRRFEDMPILADALEDAGCDHEDILRHCREPGQHVRGCWVVDLLLGKE